MALLLLLLPTVAQSSDPFGEAASPSPSNETIETQSYQPKKHFSLDATPQTAPNERYGLVVGPVLSSASVNSVDDPSGRTERVGYTLGGYFEFPLTNWLWFHPEANLTLKGSYDSAGDLANLSYLEIPLLLELSFGSPNFRFFFPFGPAFSLLMDGSFVSKIGSIEKIDGSGIASLEASLLAGAGVEIGITKSLGVLALARYDYGLTNVARFHVAGQGATYYSRVFSFLVGFSFRQDTRHLDID